MACESTAEGSQAKEAMTAKYSAPLLQAFGHYYELIASKSSEDFHLDANTTLTVDALGKQREVATLSAGYRDLAGICLRMALVDAMYEEERPMLILDDPFTNLDDDKVNRGKEFLEQVSAKYQVIYFTCSSQR